MKLLNDRQRAMSKSAALEDARSANGRAPYSRTTNWRSTNAESSAFRVTNPTLRKAQLSYGLFGMAVGALIFGSIFLAIPLGALGAIFPIYRSQKRAERRQRELARIWPELLDHMISGLRSGLSIAETISSLSKRGPEISRSIFQQCQADMVAGTDVQQILNFIKEEFNDPIADQVCEVLDFARGTGSRDTAVTLRTLGDFIRTDIAVRGEIHAKLGWVRNSAVIAAAAPWILLAILASQPTTIIAYKTSTGIVILSGGVLMSLLAYVWMAKVGKVHTTPRIFAAAGRA